MRVNGVPRMARKKIGASLVHSMIGEYVSQTTTSSSLSLATFMGLPPGMEFKGEEVEDDPEKVKEFDARAEGLYLEIFPEHAACGDSHACNGHNLPSYALKILGALEYPEDLTILSLRAKNWFAAIDVDGSNGLDSEEVKAEFLKIGLDEEEAHRLAHLHKTDESTLDVPAFINTITHILDNAVPYFSAANVVMLGYLFEQYDEDGDGQIDMAEFKNLTLDMVKACFVFNGGEALDTLSITQLDVLRRHGWRRRKMETNVYNSSASVLDQQQAVLDCEEEEVIGLRWKDIGPRRPHKGTETWNPRLAQTLQAKTTFTAEELEELGATDLTVNTFILTGKSGRFRYFRPMDSTEEDDPEPMYTLSKTQRADLKKICSSVRTACTSLFPQDKLLCQRARELSAESRAVVDDHELVQLVMELKDKIKKNVQKPKAPGTSIHGPTAGAQGKKQWKAAMGKIKDRHEFLKCSVSCVVTVRANPPFSVFSSTLTLLSLLTLLSPPSRKEPQSLRRPRPGNPRTPHLEIKTTWACRGGLQGHVCD